MSHRNQEILLPSIYWNKLTQEDKTEFQKLRNHFHQSQKISSKDSRLVSFSNELHTVLKYIEHSEQGRECRTILTGVAFAGPFICVNTRQLKCFLGRCKSSINGSFQQLGYVAIKTKSKARACILAILPSLISDQNILRQWTVRCASEDAKFCFVTSLTSIQLPIVTNDDLNDDHKGSQQSMLVNSTPSPSPLTLNNINSSSLNSVTSSSIVNPVSGFSTGNINMAAINNSMMGITPMMNMTVQQQINSSSHHVSWASDLAFVPDMPMSYSVESFTDYGDGFSNVDDFSSEWNPMYEKVMKRSQSANFANDTYGACTLDYSMF